MPTHAEKRKLPYTKQQLFALVADVERYPEFLPWCLAARINRREGDVFWADLVIGFKMVKERFTSRVELTSPDRVDVSYSEGPFKHMNTHWIFIEDPDDHGTWIDFYVDFEFRSPLLQKIIGFLFGEAVAKMVSAFEARAEILYGSEDPQR
ncbi:type II toxin-antitoxin system RatA family toxin [Haematospirillum jordaniae]|uniref:type II toxin-antitoxin system RatA family toxin n=1 Tax=Haematospirillum jordaniae TaxID=1549855 RepID=UPI001432F6BD|nr:type II toxin-antitoxin system RatA family toxin [Haematospirillum jordaniae]NKD46093.1 type II toxin-antitoxin system RatA family toxin [Haematospirillum jordaniae]NKD91371.1 type II toxin-antitoxin system RatA family toxin [Haematospirillum jordaniae]